MRIFISADIEGIAGVVSREHQFPEGIEWQSARLWMTDSVAAAAEAAFEAGAIEVVVADSHGRATTSSSTGCGPTSRWSARTRARCR